MEYRRFENTVFLRLDPGEEIIEKLTVLAKTENITLGSITGLGAVREATLGVFDTEEKQYYGVDYEGQFEIGSLVGSITQMDGEPYLHLHMTVANPHIGQCYSGHLSKGVVSATAEIVIQIVKGKVGRKFSEKIGLNLFKFEE